MKRCFPGSSAVLIFVLLFFSPVGGMAADAACEQLFSGYNSLAAIESVSLRPRADSFVERAFRSRDIEDLGVTRHRPDAGPGTLWVARFPERWVDHTLLEVVAAFPSFFSSFDMHAHHHTIATIPDSVRLNWLRSLRGQISFDFVDQKLLGAQRYTNEDFFAMLLKRRIPIATRGEFFVHDRLDEHLIGALLLPDFAVDAMVDSAQTLKKLSTEPWILASPIANSFSDIRLHFGSNWDQVTSRSGKLAFSQTLLEKTKDGTEVGFLVDQWTRSYQNDVAAIFDRPLTLLSDAVLTRTAHMLRPSERHAFLWKVRDALDDFNAKRPTLRELQLNAVKTYAALTNRDETDVQKIYDDWLALRIEPPAARMRRKNLNEIRESL